MKIINTRLHGMLDYGTGFILLLPWIIDFYTADPGTRIFAALGTATLIVSLCTDYEFGLLKLIPMKGHLVFDVILALFLVAMPWLLPTEPLISYWPLLLGVGVLLVVVLSSASPYRYTRQDLNITQP